MGFSKLYLTLAALATIGLCGHAVLTEQEPNDGPVQAQTIARGATGWSDFGNFQLGPQDNDLDWFKVQLEAGEQIVLQTDGLACGDTDTVVAVINPDGTQVVAFNDDGGPGFGSRIEHIVTQSGLYYIAVVGFHDVVGQASVDYYLADHPENGCYRFDILIQPAPPLPIAIELRDGNSLFFIGPNFISGSSIRTGGSGGLGDHKSGALDHMFQHWYWYRATGMSREFAISNFVSADVVSPRETSVFYREPEGIDFDTNWQIREMGQDPDGNFRNYVQITIRAMNRTALPTTLDLFSYSDYDLDITSNDDSAQSPRPNHIQIVDIAVVNKVSNSQPFAWQIGQWPAIRNSLADGFVTNLTNGVSPFGPGDFSGAMQQRMALQPGATETTVIYLCLNMGLPGDTNGDACVDDVDLAQVLSLFGLSDQDAGYDLEADFNRDGIIDDTDLAIVLDFFGVGC